MLSDSFCELVVSDGSLTSSRKSAAAPGVRAGRVVGQLDYIVPPRARWVVRSLLLKGGHPATTAEMHAAVPGWVDAWNRLAFVMMTRSWSAGKHLGGIPLRATLW